MKDEFVTDLEITRFLLGDVNDEDRQSLERLFISDPKSRERILIVENDLIDDYLEDCLSASDREKFVRQYGETPQHRRKIRIARSIKEYAVSEVMLTRPVASANPKWRNFLSSLGLRRPIWLIPVAALTVACVVAFVWLVQLNRRKAQENDRRVAIERELVDLNAPSSIHDQMFSIVLPPVSVRSVQSTAELTPRADLRVVELQLLWTQKEQYKSYRAVLRRIDDTEQFTVPNLHVENSSGGRAVRVRLPTRILRRGLYQVNVTGVAEDGASGQVEEYTFTVGG